MWLKKMFHVKPKLFLCDFCDSTKNGALVYLSKGGCPVCDSPVQFFPTSKGSNHVYS
jgi:hypothetical protein